MDTKTVSKMDKMGLKWMEWMGKGAEFVGMVLEEIEERVR